jgi:DNA-nicking Smr family endonuclease
MSEDDIWALYTKGVKKLSDEKEKEETLASLPAPHKIEKKEEMPLDAPPPPLPQASLSPQERALDVRIERNLSLGEVVIEARLDLHGRTESEAHADLCLFIEKNYYAHRRMLLVITGKGSGGLSVLRTQLPRWCDVSPLREMVLAVRSAAAHHGGDGAYYLLLRKKK